MNGILLINKEKNMTSRDVVNQVCKILKTKKIGHNGTLDPFATGVLVLCIGKCTKYVELITAYDKEYIADIVLGVTTDTLDCTGNITSKKDTYLTLEQIKQALKAMTKTYMQEVPIYSAVKINGKKLYEYARNNEEVTLPKREVTIKELELISDIKYFDNKVSFKIRCTVSKGTYIRSLVRDLASSLNTVGMLDSLTRTRQGMFKIEDTYTLEDITNNKFNIIKRDIIFKDYYTVNVDNNLGDKIKNGCILDNTYNQNYILFKDDQDNLLALYKTYEKDKTKIKPFKML